MPILTPSEVAVYAPSLTLTGAALDSALIQAQLLIEGSLGARRPLEVNRYTDTLDLSADRRAYLSYVPIVPLPVATAKLRVGYHTAYGLSAQGSRWHDLSLDYLLIDRVTGEAQVLDYGHLQSSLYAVAQPSHHGHGHRHRPTQRFQAATLQVEYSSGFDFANPSPATVADVLKIKYLFGQALTLSQGDAAKGIKVRRVDREYSVEYQSSFFLSRVEGVSGIKTGVVELDNVLKSFHIYRPRVYAL